jgi:predicted CoA-binding protein
MENHVKTVVVLGASDNPERYSNMAACLLKRHGYRVIPVHPRLKEVEDLPVTSSLEEIDEEVHTLTLYVGPLRSKILADAIVTLKPGRVIFNPGSESEELEEKLLRNHIPVVKACTLVMLHSGQF